MSKIFKVKDCQYLLCKLDEKKQGVPVFKED